MSLRVIRLGAVVWLLACAGCGGDNDASKPRQPEPRNTTIAAGRKPSAPVPTSEMPVGQVLRFPGPGGDYGEKWLEYSDTGDANNGDREFRIPGDAFSKYYVVDVDSSEGDVYSSIRNEKKEWIGDIGDFPDLVGVRKTPGLIVVFGYYSLENSNDVFLDSDRGLGTYNLAWIKAGRVHSYICFVDQTLFQRAAGKRFSTKQEMREAEPEVGQKILDLLTSAEPALERDHCKYFAPNDGQP